MRQLVALLIFALLCATARAEVPTGGTFVAQRSCPAFQSINRQTNPGNIAIAPGDSYELIAVNNVPATHYRIVIPGAQPDRRWVAIECGAVDGFPAEAASAPAPRLRLTLAVSWQPAFCETHPHTSECRSQTAGRFDASHFSLHGLWPEPIGNIYCGVPANQMRDDVKSNWQDLPPVSLSPQLRDALDRVMPGTRSQLERHEWIKHGTCYGATQEQYFTDAVALIDALNRSSVAELFAANIGRQLSQRQIRSAFDAALGPGTGQRVSIDCQRDDDRFLINELTISLGGPVTADPDLGALANAVRPTDGGCSIGMIDPAGLQ